MPLAALPAAGITHPALRAQLALFVSMTSLPQLVAAAALTGACALVLRQRETRPALMVLCSFLSAAFVFAAGARFFAGLFLETHRPAATARAPRASP